MKNKFKLFLEILTRKYVRWGIIPFLLILFWIFFSVFFSTSARFSILSYLHNKDILENQANLSLTKGNIIKGEFKALENNLGIFWVSFKEPRFVDYEKEDTIIFRIKEKSSKDWHSVNTYKSGLIYGTSFFPFGFSQIDNSINKRYIFEIESLNGNRSNLVSLDKNRMMFLSSYSFSKNEIFKSNNSFLSFIFKKIITSFSNIDFALHSTIYLIPLLYYFLWHIALKKIILNKYFLLISAITLITIDILIIYYEYAGIILAAIGIWIVAMLINNFKSKMTYSVSLFLLLICVVINMFGERHLLNKLSSWAFYLLLIGAMQDLWGLRERHVDVFIKKIKNKIYFL